MQVVVVLLMSGKILSLLSLLPPLNQHMQLMQMHHQALLQHHATVGVLLAQEAPIGHLSANDFDGNGYDLPSCRTCVCVWLCK